MTLESLVAQRVSCSDLCSEIVATASTAVVLLCAISPFTFGFRDLPPIGEPDEAEAELTCQSYVPLHALMQTLQTTTMTRGTLAVI